MNTLALCIPAYNAVAYLPRLLTSATNQYIPFTEILIYDDCSTDNTAEVARRYGATVIKGSINKGCSFGKNILAEKTTCQWIHFHDADDELLPNFTTLAYKWINNLNCPDVVLFDYEYRDNDTNHLLSTRNFDKAALEKDAVAYSITEQINPFCGLYKKTSFIKAGGYDTDPLVLYNEDKALHIRLATHGLKFTAESEISIINYRVLGSMSAANTKKCSVAQYYVLAKTANTLSGKYQFELARQLSACIASLAATQDWTYVKKALSLSKNLGYRVPPSDNKMFKYLNYLNPFFAAWFREKTIRLIKPHLRKNEF